MTEINVANVLLALRDHVANDVNGLYRVLKASEPYGRIEIEGCIRLLEHAGLVVHNGPAGDLSSTFEVTPTFQRMQQALGFSLRKLGTMGPDSVVVKPLFGAPAGLDTPLDVFVVMAFKPELKPVYEDHILNVTKSLKLVVKRADDFFGAHQIMSDVWEAINAARVIVADCTGRNPNVFYEIGVAHTLGRPVILTAQSALDVPFDLQSIRYIQYEYTPRGMASFEKNLAETLKSELEL